MQEHTEQSPSSGNLFFSVFPSVMLPMFLAVVDQTIVSTALPAIAANLGSVERVSWVVVAYLSPVKFRWRIMVFYFSMNCLSLNVVYWRLCGSPWKSGV